MPEKIKNLSRFPMELFKQIPVKYKLLLIIIIGFVLRTNNLTIGFPILFVSNDEAIYHQSALNMLANKTPFTIGNYGPLGAYVQIPFLLLAFAVFFLTGRVNSVSDMEFLLVTQEGYMLFIPRIISAMFGTLSIIAIYLLCVELFKNRKIALWASLFAAVSFNLVHVSHLARGWSPAIFFSLLATLFVLRSVLKKNHALRNLLLSVFFSSIAFGFHQLSGIVLILISLIRFFGGKSSNKRIFSKDHLVVLTLLSVMLFVLNYLSAGGRFFSLLSPTNAEVGLIQLPANVKNLWDFLVLFARNNNFLKIIRDLILTDGLVVISALLFFISKKNRSGIYTAFFLFFLISILLSSLILPSFLRYLLVAIALMPVFAAYTIHWLLARTRWQWLLVLVIVVLSTFNSMYWNLLILRKPTFDQVRKWLDQNISVEVPIAYSASRYFGYTPSLHAGEVIRRFQPNYYLRSARLIKEVYPFNVRNILYTNQLDGTNKKERLERGIAIYPVNFVIDSYLIPSDRLLPLLDQKKFKLVAHFSPTKGKFYAANIPEPLTDPAFNFPLFKIDRAGPYFDVFKVE